MRGEKKGALLKSAAGTSTSAKRRGRRLPAMFSPGETVRCPCGVSQSVARRCSSYRCYACGQTTTAAQQRSRAAAAAVAAGVDNDADGRPLAVCACGPVRVALLDALSQRDLASARAACRLLRL